MSVQTTIIIPHKPGPLNNQALELNISMLMENSVYPFELIIDTEVPKDPYQVWNYAAPRAKADILVFTNSDVLMAPGWDKYLVDEMTYNAILVGYLVECGAIGVASENIHVNFGMYPGNFQRAAFESYARDMSVQVPDVKTERGWYMPCAVRKHWFLSTGGFDTTIPFPEPNDIKFWNKCVADYGTSLYRVNSWAYHFQNLSGRDK